MRIFVPKDSAACSVGAQLIAHELKQQAKALNQSVEILRNGSRGLYWLEPLVEIQQGHDRLLFGPMDESDVEALLDPQVDFTGHPKYLGRIEDIPQYTRQNRVTFDYLGVTLPDSIDSYCELGGFTALKSVLAQTPQTIIEQVTESGLRGRGGAGFPTGTKWKTVFEATGKNKYVVANADEGDSGTFADRLVMEGDPFALIEGMAIAGIATGATQGFIYIRVEYPAAIKTLEHAIQQARDRGFLGQSVCHSDKRFDIELRIAAGAYICGEETSLLESLEGKRGEVRFRPPLPAIKGLFDCPTVVNNVVTLATVPKIINNGPSSYAGLGCDRSLGTLTAQIGGNAKHAGLYEIEFGMTLKELVYDLAGGTRTGRPVKAVQAGGPLGAFIPAQQFDTKIDYESFQSIGAMLGHGGFVLFDDTMDMGELARFSMEFCAIESCGKCTPCRIGSVRGTEVIDKIRLGQDRAQNLKLLRDLCETMVDGSLCGLGGMAPFPVMSVLEHFEHEL